MGTVTYTVGTSGRNYSTLAAAYAAVPANLVTDGNSYILSCYNDSELTSTTTLAISGNTTDSTHTLKITAASGQSFADNASAQTNALKYNASNGVGFKVTGSYQTAITCSVSNVSITRMQIYGNANLNGDSVLHSTASSGFVVDTCIIQLNSTDNGSNNTVSDIPTGTVTNSLFLNIGQSNNVTAISGGYNSTTHVANCTLVNASDKTPSGTSQGLKASSGSSVHVENCAVFGFGSVVNTNSLYSGSNNCSDKTIGFGSANQASKTYANQFQSTTAASPDYRLKSGADCVDNGATDTTDIPSAVDIVGTSRPQGAAWDIGCWELKSSTQSFSYTASGGVVFAGASTEVRSEVYSATGGVVFSGSATETRGISYTPVGGVTFGGNAALVKSTIRLPSGGITFVGSAAVSSHHAGQAPHVLKRWLYMAGRR